MSTPIFVVFCALISLAIGGAAVAGDSLSAGLMLIAAVAIAEISTEPDNETL